MKDLESISLENTNVTDAGLVHLLALPKLHGVSLAGNHISNAGLADLQRLNQPGMAFNPKNRSSIARAASEELQRARDQDQSRGGARDIHLQSNKTNPLLNRLALQTSSMRASTPRSPHSMRSRNGDAASIG